MLVVYIILSQIYSYYVERPLELWAEQEKSAPKPDLVLPELGVFLSELWLWLWQWHSRKMLAVDLDGSLLRSTLIRFPLQGHQLWLSPTKQRERNYKYIQLWPCGWIGCLCHMSYTMQRKLTLHLVQIFVTQHALGLLLDFLLQSHHPYYVVIYQLLFRMLTWRKSHFMWEVLGSEDSQVNGNPQEM